VPHPYFAPPVSHLVPDAGTLAPRDDLPVATRTEQDRDEVLGTTPEVLREQALRRFTKRRELKTHAVVFTLVNLTVWGMWVAIAATSDSWWPWPVFLTLFWGIGLVMNAWDVYFRKPITEQELKREIDRLESSD
jgi:2TM domain